MTDIQSLGNQLSSLSAQAGDASEAVPGRYALPLFGAVADVAKILISRASEEQKAQAIRDRIGVTVADCYTFGLASVAYHFVHKQFPGFVKQLDKLTWKLDPLSRWVTGLFDTDKWKTEGNRMRDLVKSGVQVPESLQGAMSLTRGRSKEELVDWSVPLDFTGYKPDGTWTNNRFAISRNEADLRPQDIWGYAAFFEKFGNDWLGKFSENQRREIAQKALDFGCVREHHGTIDINWTPDLERYTSSLGQAR